MHSVCGRPTQPCGLAFALLLLLSVALDGLELVCGRASRRGRTKEAQPLRDDDGTCLSGWQETNPAHLFPR